MSGNFSFSNIPSNLRVPGPYVEIDENQSNLGLNVNQNILVIGQLLSSGTVDALTPIQVTSYAQAQTYFGPGSMLANMLKKVFANNAVNPVWVVGLDDVSGGTAASGTIVVTASSASAGTLSLYFGDVLVPVTVNASDSATTIASSIKDAINALTTLPVTATSSTGTVTITYRHKGVVGNYYAMNLNYLGAQAGESTPSGVSLAITQLDNGATNPALTDAFAVLPNVIYAYIIHPYIDSTNLNAMDAELVQRWLSTSMLEGHSFTAANGSVSTVGTLGAGRNSQYATLIDAGLNSATPPYEWASAYAAQVAQAGDSDPGRPFTGLPLNGVFAEPLSDQRVWQDRQTLLGEGVATHTSTAGGQVNIERCTTCYQKDTSGNSDLTYLDINTVLLLSALRQDVVGTVSRNFKRFKLADDGTSIPANSNIVTPTTIKAQIVARAMVWAGNGWIQNLSSFIATLDVRRNTSDPSRLDCVMYPQLINQFQVFAAAIQFSI